MKGSLMGNEVENKENAAEETPVTSVEADASASAPKKKGKSRVIILTVVIVVVLLFGTGGIVYATQHSNPEFCNAICHAPMDAYVESFMEGTSVNPQQTDLEFPLGVTIHAQSDQDIVCVTCHTDGIDAQIQEGISWVTGAYTLPLNLTMTVKEPTQAHERSGITTCLSSGCHEGISSLDDLKEATSDLKRNPHESHNGDQNCTTCHQMHEQSVNTCTQCHADAQMPDGWLTYNEQQKQIKEAAAA